MSIETEVLIIGGGPGGYTAAIRAAQHGKKVMLVEKDKLGGVCLNWGCIPTKALLHAADTLREIRHADSLGIRVSEPQIDLGKMVRRSRDVAAKLNQGIEYLMKKNAISVIQGEAAFVDKHTLQVGDKRVQAQQMIIATGARARALPGVVFDGKVVWNARDAMTPAALPKRLLIVGAGAIGVEFASLYATLGTKVTLLEAQPQIMPAEDKAVAECLHDAFTKQGIEVLTGATLDKTSVSDNRVSVEVNGELREYDALLVSIGVQANTESLNLDAAGVVTEKGFVRTNDRLQTSEPHIYAIGDVVGAPCLAHKAAHEGIIAADHMAGLNPHAMDPNQIPRCTYSYPQVASVGLTEEQARAKGDIRVGTYPLAANGKAIAVGSTEGFVKTVFDKHTGELYGAHMVGANVTEMIQGYVASMALETTDEELSNMIFAHPTISEAMHEAVLDAQGRAINY